jgi:hypothetical protein
LHHVTNGRGTQYKSAANGNRKQLKKVSESLRLSGSCVLPSVERRASIPPMTDDSESIAQRATVIAGQI